MFPPELSRRDRCASMVTVPLLTTLLALLQAGPAGASPPADASSAFDDFAPQAEFPDVETLRGVLRPVDGIAGEISESNKLGRTAARITGLLRYDEVWPVGSSLRIALLDTQSLAIHLWAGERGVSLQTRSASGRNGAQWVVYDARRQDAKPRPDQRVLWATDEGRFRRAGEGTFELRWADGLLAMTRGDMVLWRVPLEKPPQEVYFDGMAIVRGVGAFRSPPQPPEEADLPLLDGVPKPAQLAWQEKLSAEATLTKLADDGVELASTDRTRPALVFANVAPPGLYEFVFEVENPRPGTGVYLGDESGEPLGRVGFFRLRGHEELTFGLAAGRSSEVDRSYPDPTTIPYAGTRQWLRLVLAGGICRCWTSGDGRHWRQPPESTVRASGGCRTVGLYCLADGSPRGLRLRNLQVRRLDALAALAPAELVAQAHRRPMRGSRSRKSFGPWPERPEGVGEESWRRAMALAMLIDAPQAEAGLAAIGMLFRETLQTPRSVDECMRLLAQAARVMEAGEGGRGTALAALYEPLGRRLMAQRDPLAFTRVRRAMFESVASPMPAAAAGQLLRYQLLLAAYEGRWADLTQLAKELLYWSRSRAWTNQPLAPWEQATGPVLDWVSVQLEAQRRAREPQAETPGKIEPQPASALPLVSRGRKAGRPRLAGVTDTTHPLVDRLGKEAYNVAADLEAALAGGSLREACQVIRDAGKTAEGLVPGDDSQLVVSLRATIEQALAKHSAFAQTMEQSFGALAELRFRQAAEAADTAGVELLVDQFPGTQVARRAEQWLGDRALAAGQLALALAHYRRAAASASDPAAARLRLVGALLGQSLGDRAAAAVELGDTRMPAAEFEQLIAALHTAPTETSAPAIALPTETAMPVEALVWGQIPVGPEQRAWNVRGPLDLAARQTLFRFTAETLLISTPARLMAFRLTDGRLVWSYSIPSSGDRWPSVADPGEPVVAGPRLLLRQGWGRSAALVALERSTGSLQWTSPDDTPVISDPIVVGSCVFALLATPDQAGQLAIQMAEFDVGTGRVLGRWSVATLRDLWQGSLGGRIAWADDTLIATVGGCALACDTAGRVRWVRRQLFLGPAADRALPWRVTRSHEAPRVVQGRVYATQPGVWAVDCLDLASGRLLWRYADPDLVTLVTVDAQRVVLANSTGLVGLDAKTGKTVWSHVDVGQLEAGAVCDGRHVFHATFHREFEGAGDVLLEGLDLASGELRAKVPLAVVQDRRPGFGPLAVGAGHLWAILSRSDDPLRYVGQLKIGKP